MNHYFDLILIRLVRPVKEWAPDQGFEWASNQEMIFAITASLPKSL